MTDPTLFCQLKQLRQQHGVSPVDVADATGLTRQTIGAIAPPPPDHGRAMRISSIAIALLPSVALMAVEPTPPPSLEERIKTLELQIETLHQRVATSPRPVANTKDGFGFVSADGTFKLKLWGYLHGEGRLFLNDEEVPLTNTFVLRRARIVVDGSVGPFDFRVMPDFGNGTTVLLDAWIAAPIRPWFRLQVGRGKVPIGLEFLQGDTVTMFIERAYPTQLVPNRDNGVQVSGDLADGRLTYTVGVYNGAVDGGSRDTDVSDDKDGVARFYATPFFGGAPALAGFSIGLGASIGQEDGTAAASSLPTYRSPGQATIFSYVTATPATLANTAIGDGDRWRLAPQAYYAVGPFSTMAEYTRSSQEIRLGAVVDEVVNEAWQVSLGWVLSGESAAFKGLAPASPVAFDGSGWGALELVARIHRLDIDETAFDRGFASRTASITQATGYAIGLNWYMTRQVKLKLNYERTTFVDGAGSSLATLHDREDEHLISTQLQLVY